MGFRFRGGRGQPDPAGLSAPADVHLGLDDDSAAELFRDPPRLRRGAGDLPRRDGNAGGPKQFLGLILVNVHTVQGGCRSICPAAERAACAGGFA